jgi:hypothetical protein
MFINYATAHISRPDLICLLSLLRGLNRGLDLVQLCAFAVSSGRLKLSKSSLGTLIAIRAPCESLAVELALLLELLRRQNGADVAA